MLIEIVPYILGAAVSPVVLAMAVLLLAQPQKPVAKTFLYALGGTLTATAIGSAIFFTVHARSQTTRPTLSDSLIHIMIGIVLLGLAVRIWRKPAKKAKTASKKVHYSRDFLLGVALMASNFTSLIMFVPAGLELQAATTEVRLTGLVLLIISATLAMWVPLLLVIISGQQGQKLLKKLSGFMARHGQQVSGGLIGLIALYVLYKGVSGL